MVESANTRPGRLHPVKLLKNSQDNSNCQETKSVAPIICVHVRGKFDSSDWTKTRKVTSHLG